MNTHLITTVNEKLGFLEVKCKEGHYITNWDKKDVVQYNSATVMYCPMSISLDDYYCVTDEENERLIAQQIERLKEIEEEERLKNEID